MLSLTHILNFEGQKGRNFQSPANIPSHFVLEPMLTTPANPPTSPQLYTSPPVTIVLTVILLLFFFIGFFAIYFCRCFMQNLLITWHIRQSPSGTSVSPANGAIVAPGLDPLIITSFPTFLYSSVKEYRMEKVGLECAICLCEFEDDDALRLLPTCCHVFHQECIDLWLESHKSCPFCRRALDKPSDKSPNISILGSTLHQDIIPENESLEATFTINIKDDNEKFGREASNKDGKSTSSMPGSEQSGGSMMAERFARSKSTGHSIVRSDRRGEDEDRFTLRLPEHVQTKLLRGHQATRSCTSFGEFKSKTSTGNGGFDEVSTGDFKSIVIG